MTQTRISNGLCPKVRQICRNPDALLSLIASRTHSCKEKPLRQPL